MSAKNQRNLSRPKKQCTKNQQQKQSETFGEMNFQNAQLGDARRTRRLVETADALTRHAGESLPQRLKTETELQGFYRLCTCPQVTHASVLQPHVERTFSILEARCKASEVTLILHDSSELDYTHMKSLTNLGQIGNGSRRGYVSHNSLAVDPQTREVIGLTGQILHRRIKVRKNETAAQRRKRKSRESRLWVTATKKLSASKNLVDVCDRGADTFEFLEHDANSGRTFVVRSSHNRAISHEENDVVSDDNTSIKPTLLHDYSRSLPAMGKHTSRVTAKTIEKKPKRSGKKKTKLRASRQAELSVSFAPVLLKAPRNKNGQHGNAPLCLWIVRVWEENPPSGEEALEWFLLTNKPIASLAEALEVIGWYECRWVIEELHKAMKSGCKVEKIPFTNADRQQPAIALLSIVAISLLNLRTASRAPDAKQRRATEIISRDKVQLLSVWRTDKIDEEWSVYDFFYALARLGGHQNRKHDHPPGWQILWRGWSDLQLLHTGAETQKRLKKCA